MQAAPPALMLRFALLWDIEMHLTMLGGGGRTENFNLAFAGTSGMFQKYLTSCPANHSFTVSFIFR